MAIKVLIIAGIIALIAAFACKSTIPPDPNHLDKISFGSYGGFAGSYTEYVVLPNGKSYVKKSLRGEYSELGSLKKRDINQFNEILQNLKSEKYSISDPGNMTYFVRVHEHGKEPYELLWGGSNQTCDQRVVILHKSMSLLCKDNHPVM